MRTDGDVEAALEVARSMLQGDGYDVQLSGHADGELKLTIVAGADACEECLVPKDVLARIIATTLPPDLAGTRITLTYPTDRSV
jgi:hypothetical protein